MKGCPLDKTCKVLWIFDLQVSEISISLNFIWFENAVIKGSTFTLESLEIGDCTLEKCACLKIVLYLDIKIVHTINDNTKLDWQAPC